jgi:mono/diheme cytochrome c family protein
MRKELLIFIVGVLGMTFLSSNFQQKPSVFLPTSDDIDPLVVYGESIFNKEKCMSCHTLTLQDSTKISLDGFSTTTFSSTWLYQLFENPKQLIPRCQMPAFPKLLETSLSKSRLESILVKHTTSFDLNQNEKEWTKMINKSDSISLEIYRESGIQVNRKEVLALIAYLKQIPSSPLKQMQDSIQKEKEAIEVSKTNELISNLENDFKKYQKDKKMIKKGEESFQMYCAVCHKANGSGDLGPSLVDKKSIYGDDVKNMFKTIYLGTENGMPENKSKMTPNQIVELIVYIRSLKKN